MTMTGKTRYNAPPLVLFIFQKRFLSSLFWNESYFSTQHGKQGLRKYVSQWKVTNESVKWNFFANNNTPVPLHNGWIRKIGVIQMRVKLLHFVQTNTSVYSSNLSSCTCKGFLYLKAHLNYCEHLRTSCENLTFVSLLKQNHLTDLSSACRLR